MADPTFTPEDSDDPEAARKILRGLRRMAAYGRMAQRALDRIAHDGANPGRVPLVVHAWNDKVRADHAVVVKRLPRCHVPTRGDLPGYGSWEVELGNPLQEEVSGSTVTELPVRIACVCLRSVHRMQESWEDAHVLVGLARIKSDGSTVFVHHRPEGSPHQLPKGVSVHKVYRDGTASPGSMASFVEISRTVAYSVVQTDRDDVRYGNVPQRILALQKALPNWLIEDGLIEDLSKTLLQARIAAVLHA